MVNLVLEHVKPAEKGVHRYLVGPRRIFFVKPRVVPLSQFCQRFGAYRSEVIQIIRKLSAPDFLAPRLTENGFGSVSNRSDTPERHRLIRLLDLRDVGEQRPDRVALLHDLRVKLPLRQTPNALQRVAAGVVEHKDATADVRRVKP